MSRRKFTTQLSILTTLVALALIGLHELSDAQSFQLYSWISLIGFVGLSIVMYALGYQSIKSTNKYAFTNVAILMMIFKMFLCVAIVLVYKLNVQSASMLFIGMFLGIYVVYTIFETYFMMRLSKMKI